MRSHWERTPVLFFWGIFEPLEFFGENLKLHDLKINNVFKVKGRRQIPAVYFCIAVYWKHRVAFMAAVPPVTTGGKKPNRRTAILAFQYAKPSVYLHQLADISVFFLLLLRSLNPLAADQSGEWKSRLSGATPFAQSAKCARFQSVSMNTSLSDVSMRPFNRR